MSKFFFVMQHVPTVEQLAAAAAVGEVVQLADKKLLNVPDDAVLSKDLFKGRAAEIETALGGFGAGDTVHAMGQAQLAAAITARARKVGANLVESVTPSDFERGATAGRHSQEGGCILLRRLPDSTRVLV